MGAFTTIATGDDLQLLTPLNEIVSSWYERRQAIGDTTVIPALAAGDDIQDHQFWQDIQDWCTAECVHFVNDGVGVSGSTITMFTAATWKNAAGIGNGFRRVTGTTPPADWTDYEDIAYSYGIIEAGDMFGPWLYVDLQNALKALKWTTSESTTLNSDTNKSVLTYGSLATHEADWLAKLDWDATGLIYSTRASASSGMGGSYASLRNRGKASIVVPTFANSAYDVYAIVGKPSSSTFRDVDSLGLVEGDLFLFDSGAASNVSPRLSANITPDNADAPCNLLGGDEGLFGASLSYTSYWIWKWTFSFDS